MKISICLDAIIVSVKEVKLKEKEKLRPFLKSNYMSLSHVKIFWSERFFQPKLFEAIFFSTLSNTFFCNQCMFTDLIYFRGSLSIL